MPYSVFKQDDQWCVYKVDDNKQKVGKTLGCHDSEDKAKKQISAVSISEHSKETNAGDLLAIKFAERLGYEVVVSKEQDENIAVIDIPSYGRVKFPVDVSENDLHNVDFCSPVEKESSADSYSVLKAMCKDYPVVSGSPRENIVDSSKFFVQEKQSSDSTCMRCDSPPEVVCIWADGRARAWFCKDHFDEWKEEDDMEIVWESTLEQDEDPIEKSKEFLEKKTKETDSPQEEASGICSCPECGYEQKHARGEPCAERYCPRCGAKMERKDLSVSKDIVIDEEKNTNEEEQEVNLQNFWVSTFQKIKSILFPKSNTMFDIKKAISEVSSNGSSFFSFKEADTGKYRWVTISSTGFFDRDGEIVSSKALRQAVEKAKEDGRSLGHLKYWHEDVYLGTCDLQMCDGVCLIESGTWNEDSISTNFRKDTEKNPEKWGISIGFSGYLKDVSKDAIVNGRVVKSIYEAIEIKERSLLPKTKSANVYSLILSGGQNMDTKKLDMLKEVVGPDILDQLVKAVDGVNDEAKKQTSVVKSASEDGADSEAFTSFKENIDKLAETDSDMADAILASVKEMTKTPVVKEEESPSMVVKTAVLKSLDDMPDCPEKDAVLAVFAEDKAAAPKDKKEDEEDKEDMKEDDEEDDMKKKKETDNSSEVVEAIKELTAQLGLIKKEQGRADDLNSIRAASTRPTARKENVTSTKQVEKGTTDMGSKVVSGIGNAVFEKMTGIRAEE